MTVPYDPGPASRPAPGPAYPPVHRPRWRSALAALLLAVAVVLAPVAVASGWAKGTVVSTDGFVATFGPLAQRPEVQRTITTKVVAAIEDRLGRTALPQSVVSTIGQALEQPVDRFVASSAFRTLWEDSLRSLHTQIADDTASGSSSAGVTVDSDGQVSVQLKPIVSAVRTDLVDRGFALAGSIPDLGGSVVVATVSDLPRAHEAYHLTDVLGTWSPIVVGACLLLGVLAANRRRRALATAGVLVALAMGATWLAIGVGREVAVHELSGHLTSATVSAIWDDTVASLRRVVLVVGAGSLGVAVVAALSGLFRRRPDRA